MFISLYEYDFCYTQRKYSKEQLGDPDFPIPAHERQKYKLKYKNADVRVQKLAKQHEGVAVELRGKNLKNVSSLK